MKFRRGVWAFAFAFCLAGAAKAADTKRMLSMCEEVGRGMSVREKEVTLPRSPGAYMCWGFIGAVQDVSRITDSSGARLLSACVPDETTGTEILQAFIKHARTNRRSDLELPAGAVAMEALAAAFPCDGGRQIPAPAKPLNRRRASPGHLASPRQLRPRHSERSPQAQH